MVEQSARSDAFFTARRLGHVNLYVADADRSYDFYNRVVGLDEAYVQPLNKAVFMGNNNTHHDIAALAVDGKLAMGKAIGLNHMAFELETEVDLVEGYRRAVPSGVKFSAAMDHDIAHSLYGPDPDGNMTEIYADVIKDWRAARSGVVTKAKPLWAPGTTAPTSDRNYHVNPKIRRVDGALFHPRRIVHAALVVKDMKRSFDYYTKVVGLQPLLGDVSSSFVILGGTCGERNLSLFRAGNGRPPGYHHAGFAIEDEHELNASIAKAAAQGFKVDIDLVHATRRCVFITDPDGFRVQFFVERGASVSALAEVNEDLALYLA